jgi:hypothetical protein
MGTASRSMRLARPGRSRTPARPIWKATGLTEAEFRAWLVTGRNRFDGQRLAGFRNAARGHRG